MMKIKCVQCGETINDFYEMDGGNTQLPFCTRPKCPNYGVFQTGEPEYKELI